MDSPAKKSKLAEGSACEVSNGSKRVKQVAQEPKQSPVTTDGRRRHGRSKRNVMSEESTDVSTAAAATLPADKIKTEIGADEESPSTIQVTQKKQSDIRVFMKPNNIVTTSTTDGDKIGLWCDAYSLQCSLLVRDLSIYVVFWKCQVNLLIAECFWETKPISNVWECFFMEDFTGLEFEHYLFKITRIFF